MIHFDDKLNVVTCLYMLNHIVPVIGQTGFAVMFSGRNNMF